MQTQVECSRKSTPRRRNHGRTYTRSLFACCLKRCLNPLPPLHLTCIFSAYFLLNSEHMARSSEALFQQTSLETFASNQNLCDGLKLASANLFLCLFFWTHLGIYIQIDVDIYVCWFFKFYFVFVCLNALNDHFPPAVSIDLLHVMQRVCFIWWGLSPSKPQLRLMFLFSAH